MDFGHSIIVPQNNNNNNLLCVPRYTIKQERRTFFWFKCQHFVIKNSKKFHMPKVVLSKYYRLAWARPDPRKILVSNLLSINRSISTLTTKKPKILLNPKIDPIR